MSRQKQHKGEAMRALKEKIEDTLSKVIDLFHQWDVNNDGKISKQEWTRGLRSIHFDCHPETADELFELVDKDR